MARILIADDHAEARRGARELLEAHPGWEVCGEACDGMDAIEKAAALKPDIVLLDLSMPKMSGLDAARVMHSTAPELPLLLFSLYAGDPQMYSRIRAVGFSGDINKAAANLLIEAVETLLQGGTYFQSASMPTSIIAGDGSTRPEPPPPKPPADTAPQPAVSASSSTASGDPAPAPPSDAAPESNLSIPPEIQ